MKHNQRDRSFVGHAISIHDRNVFGRRPREPGFPFPVGVWVQGPEPHDLGCAFLTQHVRAQSRAEMVVARVLQNNDQNPPEDFLEQCRDILVPMVQVKSKIQTTEDFGSMEECVDVMMQQIAVWESPPAVYDDDLS